jgi:UDP-glucose 4-epimerase
MRSLVTGAAGFIGSHLTKRLLEEGDEVVGLDNMDTGSYERIYPLSKQPYSKQFVFYQQDLLNEKFIDEMFRKHHFDRVFHLAAAGSVPRSIADPVFVARNNVGSTAVVLEASVRTGVARFVHSSSASVYGNAGDAVKKEDGPLEPENPYAVTKLACEKLVRVFHKIHGLPTVSLRYFNVFGPSQSLKGGYPAVVPAWLKAYREGDPVIVHGDGEQARDFTYVENVVEANLLAASAADGLASGLEFNIGCGERTTINQLLSYVFTALGKRVREIHDEPRPGDIRESRANITRSRIFLNYQPKVGVIDGISKTVAWFEEHSK